jgi:hypothetical protein
VAAAGVVGTLDSLFTALDHDIARLATAPPAGLNGVTVGFDARARL